MKKIITAIGNPNLNNKLKEIKEIEVLREDIQYQEAIFDILKKEKELNDIIISSTLPGNKQIEEVIHNILEIKSNIDIILIIDKENEELMTYLNMRKIKYFFNHKTNYHQIIKTILNSNNIEIELKNEIEELKKMMMKNKKILIKEELNNKFQIIKNKIKKEEKNRKEVKKKTLCFLGSAGIGKSIILINFANYLEKNNKKILIIDFDLLNQDINTILGIQKNSLNQEQDGIVKFSSNIHFISASNFVFQSENKVNIKKLENLLINFNYYYDYILIDTSSECFFDYTKTIMNLSDFNILITEGNLIEIKKTRKLLEIYLNQWKVESNKIKLIVNKQNENSIDFGIIKNIFSEVEIIRKAQAK